MCVQCATWITFKTLNTYFAVFLCVLYKMDVIFSSKEKKCAIVLYPLNRELRWKILLCGSNGIEQLRIFTPNSWCEIRQIHKKKNFIVRIYKHLPYNNVFKILYGMKILWLYKDIYYVITFFLCKLLFDPWLNSIGTYVIIFRYKIWLSR